MRNWRRVHPEAVFDPKALGWASSLALLAYLAVAMAVFAFVSRVFGIAPAIALSLITVIPLGVGLRMRWRWPAVLRSELVLLAVLIIIVCGAGVVLVQKWYEANLDGSHAEDVKYATLGRAMHDDPAFRNLKIHLSDRKHIYWVSGTVPSQGDLDRLNALAVRCGIVRDSLDGPYAHSVSLRVEGANGPR